LQAVIIGGDALVFASLQDFPQNIFPASFVEPCIAERSAVHLQVYGWIRWPVEDRMELHVVTMPVRPEYRRQDALVHDVEPAGIDQILEVAVGAAFARVQHELIHRNEGQNPV